MEPPEGLEEVMDIDRNLECMELLKCMYGLVQAARQYGKKFNKVVKGNGIEPTLVDPGLLLKKKPNDSPELYIAQHIDNSLTVGELDSILELQKHMNDNGLTTKCEELSEYLGCKIVFSKDKKKAWLGQVETIKKLERLFKDEVKHLRTYTVGGTVGKGVLRPKEEDALLNYEK